MSKNSITKNSARAHLARAHAGIEPLRVITQMAFGSGGANKDGNPIPPDGIKPNLGNELLRKNLDGYSFPSETSVTFACTISETELNGESISELALVDSGGNIVAVKTFIPKLKDDETEITFEWTEKF